MPAPLGIAIWSGVRWLAGRAATAIGTRAVPAAVNAARATPSAVANATRTTAQVAGNFTGKAGVSGTIGAAAAGDFLLNDSENITGLLDGTLDAVFNRSPDGAPSANDPSQNQEGSSVLQWIKEKFGIAIPSMAAAVVGYMLNPFKSSALFNFLFVAGSVGATAYGLSRKVKNDFTHAHDNTTPQATLDATTGEVHVDGHARFAPDEVLQNPNMVGTDMQTTIDRAVKDALREREAQATPELRFDTVY